MTNWTDGYVAEIGYTYGYYPELNPLRAELLMLYAGIEPPRIGHACELGFGQGVSVNIHAAASGIDWHGTDFNPAQARHAQHLAKSSGSRAVLRDDSFAEFAARQDLPMFDFIGLHGIWSWISDENRRVLVDFIHRRLAVGGVVYVSYNTLPGWSAFAPLRHLMTQHALTLSGPGLGMTRRVEDALAFTKSLIDSNPAYVRQNPKVTERLERITSQSRAYLAHEYFNRDWHPMYFSDMARWLEDAKLQFACSASPLDLMDNLHLSAPQREILASITDPVMRQGVRDFIVNQQFRKDYWMRGVTRLSGSERLRRLREHRIVLIEPRSRLNGKVSTSLGEVNLTPTVWQPVADLLSDHQPRSLGQIEQALEPQAITLNMICEVVMVLVGSGQIASAQSEVAKQAARPTVRALNSALVDRAREQSDYAYVACATHGGAIALNRMGQLFLRAMTLGHSSVETIAQDAWAVLRESGQRLLRDGARLETDAENLAYLHTLAQQFLETDWPLLRALGLDDLDLSRPDRS